MYGFLDKHKREIPNKYNAQGCFDESFLAGYTREHFKHEKKEVYGTKAYYGNEWKSGKKN